MRKKFIRVMWGAFVFTFGLLFLAIIAIDRGWIGYMPPLEDFQAPIDKMSSRLYSADGKYIGSWSAGKNNETIPYDSISQNMFHALMATEDVRFYDHNGIDVRAIMRAIVKRGILGQKSAGGGSTITQQLAKQMYSDVAQNSMERLLQKPIEWVIAIELERHYTKEEIMTLYLNYFDFLHNAVGVKAASRVYFNKSASELTVPEAALLAGMCKNPAYFNPVREPQRCRERRDVVLEQMADAGFISKAEAESAQAKPIELVFTRIERKGSQMPYLHEYLRSTMMAKKPERKKYSSQQAWYEDSLAWATDPLYGWCNKNHKSDGKPYSLYTDGLKVYTTVDTRMQRYAEEAAFQHVVRYLQPIFNGQRGHGVFPYIGVSKATINRIINRDIVRSDRYKRMKAAGASNDEIKRAFQKKVKMKVFSYTGDRDVVMSPIDSVLYYKSFLRTSLVSIDPMTGYVKAYVGGLDYDHFQYDMGMNGRRQVGSTMKPLVYSLAMEDGLTPDYRVKNVQRNYGGWSPKNGSKAAYGAMMPLRWGLMTSNNWITAGIMSQVDPTGRRLERLLKDVGVANYDVKPSMVLCLGPCEITACEMASAYTMFANRGIHSAPILVSRIEDANGNILAEFKPRQNEVISDLSAHEMLEMMQGVVNGGTARRVRGIVPNAGPIAAKTGTTNNNADAWFVGVVPKLVTACWVGGVDRDIHFASTSIGQGAAAALPIWGYYMRKVMADPTLSYSSQDKFPEYEDDVVGNEVYNNYSSAPLAPRRQRPDAQVVSRVSVSKAKEEGSDAAAISHEGAPPAKTESTESPRPAAVKPSETGEKLFD